MKIQLVQRSLFTVQMPEGERSRRLGRNEQAAVFVKRLKHLKVDFAANSATDQYPQVVTALIAAFHPCELGYTFTMTL